MQRVNTALSQTQDKLPGLIAESVLRQLARVDRL